jgi:hypothetical protein
MTERWIDGDAGDVIVANDTYFPIIVATWFGSPSERAVRGYFAWLDEMLARALRERVPIVNVTDSGLADVPTADVRRLVAELAKQWERAGATKDRVTSCVVVDNALIRGVLRALSWLHGDMKSQQFATCEAALAAALDILARAAQKPSKRLVPSARKRPEKSRAPIKAS